MIDPTVQPESTTGNEQRVIGSGGPAFPRGAQSGMSLRDVFAAAALQGILSNPNAKIDEEEAALSAVIHANALLARLAKYPPVRAVPIVGTTEGPQPPLRDIVFAEEVEPSKWLITLSCGHKKYTGEKKVGYPCTECVVGTTEGGGRS